MLYIIQPDLYATTIVSDIFLSSLARPTDFGENVCIAWGVVNLLGSFQIFGEYLETFRGRFHRKKLMGETLVRVTVMLLLMEDRNPAPGMYKILEKILVESPYVCFRK